MVLEFEKPIADLELKLQEMIHLANEKNIDLSTDIQSLEEKLQILKMTNDFIELHGDRTVKDDKAMIGGLGDIDGRSVMFIGQQKGRNTKLRQERNFGMANPEGYRKALRLMKMAEKFNKPIITLIDTPGAYPGIEAEERGQGESCRST